MNGRTTSNKEMSIIFLMRMSQVEEATGLKKSTIYGRISKGEFPKPRLLGPRHIAFRSDEIQKWILERPLATNTTFPGAKQTERVAQ